MNKAIAIQQDKERKGYKFRLIVPNSITEQKLAQFAGCCRKVWNLGLALVKADDEEHKTITSMFLLAGATAEEIKNMQPTRMFKFNPYSQLSAMLPQWKQDSKTSYLADAYSKSLQITLEELGQAIAEAKSKSNPKRYPVFKKRGVKDSFSFNGAIKHDTANSRIYIPKIGYIRYDKSREVLGTVKNATISKHAHLWYVSLQTERSLSQINPVSVNANRIIGIDVGIVKTISCSNDINFEYKGKQISTKQLNSVNSLKQYQAKLARLQKDLARKTKFSNNYQKIKAKITKLHTHIANIRNDFLHKVSTAIANSYAYVAAEALKIKNMSKSAKGSIEKPGKNVKQKSGLNKSILDQGWGRLKQFLTYKLKYNYGTALIEVNPHYTSQQCSSCGYIHKDNRKNQASFQCVSCNFTINADLNAALNIRTAGLAEIACGVDGARIVNTIQAQNATMNQEPTELYSRLGYIA